MAKLIATGNSIQLPLGTVQINKIQLRSLIDPEYRRIFLNDTGPTHRYVEIPRSSWTFNETTSVLTIIGNYSELEIDYVEPLDTAAISRIVPITKANTSAKRNRRVDTTANNILEAQQANKISNEGTVIGNFTETNGFKSLTPFAKPVDSPPNAPKREGVALFGAGGIASFKLLIALLKLNPIEESYFIIYLRQAFKVLINVQITFLKFICPCLFVSCIKFFYTI